MSEDTQHGEITVFEITTLPQAIQMVHGLMDILGRVMKTADAITKAKTLEAAIMMASVMQAGVAEKLRAVTMEAGTVMEGAGKERALREMKETSPTQTVAMTVPDEESDFTVAAAHFASRGNGTIH